MKKHYSGLLFHIASLPSPFGIGTLGTETLQFLHSVRNAGFSYWQILPCNLTDTANSPYKSYSSFAGNPSFIDPRLLVADGLLGSKEVEHHLYKGEAHRIDYEFARQNSKSFLMHAKKSLSQVLKKIILEFVEKEKAWLKDYAIFMTAKAYYQGKAWWHWEDEGLKNYDAKALERFEKAHQEQIEYYYFEQWVFQRQWSYLKKQANEMGLGIIGDLPFYVDSDSVDVWANRKLFDLDAQGREKQVAGVPPDYFSEKGQLWGNPIYLWKEHKKENYAWWIARVSRMMQLYDKLRLDHFRAFANYWAIPAGAEDARQGHWEQGPGMDLLSKIFEKFEKTRIIAEDLGAESEEVTELLKTSELANMFVLQFSLHSSEEKNLPYNYHYNSVTYTGTHDNNTLLGWIWSLDDYQRRFVLDYLHFSKKEDWGEGGFDSPICQAMIRQALASASKLAITTLQDLCGFGEDTRMNVPGVAEGNWTYRISPSLLHKTNWLHYKRMNQVFRRDTAFEEFEEFQKNRYNK